MFEGQFYCELCNLDLASAICLEEHRRGRKHRNKVNALPVAEREAYLSGLAEVLGRKLSTEALPKSLSEDLFLQRLAEGHFKNIVVCTGAGVSTSCGIVDFRTPQTGLFAQLRDRFGTRFPQYLDNPEGFLSRAFVNTYPEVWRNEVMPLCATTHCQESHDDSRQEDCSGHDVKALEADDTTPSPGPVHRLCSLLHEKKWLRRVYTQNVDGLHSKGGLLPKGAIVECHGSLSDDTLVLYGDPLPSRVDYCLRQDFKIDRHREHQIVEALKRKRVMLGESIDTATFDASLHESADIDSDAAVDLILVFGTCLQVAPFCAIPNLALRNCCRVLVNRPLHVCMTNDWSPTSHLPYCENDCMYGMARTSSDCQLGDRKVTLRPLWRDSKYCQLLVDGDCDLFSQRAMAEIRMAG